MIKAYIPAGDGCDLRIGWRCRLWNWCGTWRYKVSAPMYNRPAWGGRVRAHCDVVVVRRFGVLSIEPACDGRGNLAVRVKCFWQKLWR